MAAQVNCLLQHYGTDSTLGHTMMAALEHLQLKIGVEGCPLGYSFQKYGCLATDTWAKSLWEKTQAFKIDVTLDCRGLNRPRGQQDRCVMEVLVEDHDLGEDALKRVNRVRKHQEVMFLSNMATAGGIKVDSYYAEDWTRGHEGTTGKRRSGLVFRKEHPTKEDWRVWKRELSRLHRKSWALSLPLDRWKHRSHRRWKYWLDEERHELIVPTD